MRTSWAILAAATISLGLVTGCGSDSGGEDDKIASAGNNASEKSGGDNSGNSNSAGEAPAKDPEKRQLQFTECMRDEGVDMPDTKEGNAVKLDTSDMSREEIQDAMEACRKYAPAGAEDRKVSEKQKKQMRELAQCLRDEGLDVGDPDPETGRLPAEDMKELFEDGESKDPATTKALEACQADQPHRTTVVE